MLAVVCWFKRCRNAAFEEGCGKRSLRSWTAGQGCQLGISFSLYRFRPYALKKPFPLGNEEGELQNLQTVFLVIGKLEKKFPWRL